MRLEIISVTKKDKNKLSHFVFCAVSGVYVSCSGSDEAIVERTVCTVTYTVLSFGDRAQITEPPDLIEELRHLLTLTKGLYE